jgi:hypothetical protein
MITKKIFEGIFDEEVHSDFMKFSRGEFKDKYLINAKKQSNKWAIKTGHEFANNFVKSGLTKCEGKIKVTGIIATTLDIKEEMNFNIEKISNFQGVKKYIINTEIEPSNIINLIDKYPRVFFALSFSNSDMDIKIKAKPPKSSKPGKGDEDVKADFCTIKTSKKEVIEELFFDVGLDWKEISINHIIKINDIIYPEDMEKLKPAEVREKAKRKGILIRKIIIDGKEQTKQAEFIA